MVNRVGYVLLYFLGCSEVSIHERSVVAGLLAAPLAFYLEGSQGELRTIGSYDFHLEEPSAPRWVGQTHQVVWRCEGTAQSHHPKFGEAKKEGELKNDWFITPIPYYRLKSGWCPGRFLACGAARPHAVAFWTVPSASSVNTAPAGLSGRPQQ